MPGVRAFAPQGGDVYYVDGSGEGKFAQVRALSLQPDACCCTAVLARARLRTSTHACWQTVLPAICAPQSSPLQCCCLQAKINSRGFGILDIKFVDDRLGYACGGSGSLFKTGGCSPPPLLACLALQRPQHSNWCDGAKLLHGQGRALNRTSQPAVPPAHLRPQLPQPHLLICAPNCPVPRRGRRPELEAREGGR